MKRLLKLIGRVLLFVMKEFVRVLILLLVLLMIIVSGFKVVSSYYERTEIKVENNSYLELNFSANLVEKKSDSLLSFENTYNFYDVLKGIESASTDPKIIGIYINLDNMNLSVNHIEEVGEALEKFKKNGKKIYIFARIMNNQNYRLAIYGNEIIMPPISSAMLDLSGYYREFNYYKGLADYVGVKFNVIHIGDYKSYGENYYKSEMSPEYREEVIDIYDEIYDTRVSSIAKKRNLNKKLISELILSGNIMRSTPIYGREIGLVDGLYYQSEMEEKYNIKNKIKLSDYLVTVENKKSQDKIAIIYGEGEIAYGRSKKGQIDQQTIIDEFKKAQKDNNIKGIVFRINSPGGSALASEIMHHELSKITKPIYVSMGATAASGGYYISAGADKIFATQSTITGSIGVVSLIPEVSKFIKKIKVDVEKVEKGKFSGINSLTSKMTDGAMEKIRNSSLKVYEEFKERVSEGRNITLDGVEEIAGGRIWLGEEAKKIKLVDEIGGLETTISSLAKDMKLHDYQVIEIRTNRSLMESLSDYKLLYSDVEAYLKTPLEKTAKDVEINKPMLLMPYDFN